MSIVVLGNVVLLVVLLYVECRVLVVVVPTVLTVIHLHVQNVKVVRRVLGFVRIVVRTPVVSGLRVIGILNSKNLLPRFVVPALNDVGELDVSHPSLQLPCLPKY